MSYFEAIDRSGHIHTFNNKCVEYRSIGNFMNFYKQKEDGTRYVAALIPVDYLASITLIEDHEDE